MKPFEDAFDHESCYKGYHYAIRVGTFSDALTAECYFRFSPRHEFAGLPVVVLDHMLPETVTAIYGRYDESGHYWTGLEIVPDSFEQAVVFAESFIDECGSSIRT